MELKVEEKQKIIKLLAALFPGVRIILYGSRARGDEYSSSDIDLALDTGEKIPRTKIVEAREILRASHVFRRIDLVDLHAVGDVLRQNIERDGVAWKN